MRQEVMVEIRITDGTVGLRIEETDYADAPESQEQWATWMLLNPAVKQVSITYDDGTTRTFQRGSEES